MSLRYLISRVLKYFFKNGLIKTIKKSLYVSNQKELEEEEKNNYIKWIEKNEPNNEELNKQKKHKFEYNPKISIIVPMYNTAEKYLKELIESLVNQTYSNWELCLADGSEEERDYVKKLVLSDNRIKYIFLNGNKGISDNSNKAIELATGDYLALLDHDDILPQFSLFEIVKVINKDREAEFIYTDEDKLLEDIDKRISPHFKPDYAPDTLTSYNYICHFSIFKKSLINKIGVFNKEFDGSQDYDLIFRAVEQANKVVHIPKILYHWRMNKDSVAQNSSVKPYAYEAAKRAILAHFNRMNVNAIIKDTEVPGIHEIEYKVDGSPKISIIILNKDHKKDLKRCIDSIINKTTYKNYEIIIVENNSRSKKIFKYYEELNKNEKIKIIKNTEKGYNYSRLNNIGVKNSDGEYIVLLNNDIQIITENWIQNMLGICQRDDVGIVGTKLLYKDSTVQHVGIVLGLAGVAGHLNSRLNSDDYGYMSRNVIIQNFSAVTGAMLMISREDYNSVRGLDETFPIAYNDVDLCLKLLNKNKLIVMNPFVQAYHYESKTRGYEMTIEKQKRLQEDGKRLKDKWKSFFTKEDPYFNPNFRHDIGIIRIRTDKVEEI